VSVVNIRTEFTDLLGEIEDEMRLVLGERDGHTKPLYEMLAYHLGIDKREGPRAGKRIRPLLGLLVYQALTDNYKTALPGAAAVELGHNFSLVHDDIEDRGAERRHRPALWTVAGVPQAINTGDTLFTLSRMALHRLTEEGFPDAKVLALMRLYDETCLALCEGQFMDIWASEHDEWHSVDWYLDMIGRKTAALIAGSTQAGALLATDDEAVISGYRRFGWSLGLAFQLNDDLLGIWGDEAAIGKEASDIATRKKTMPLLYAVQEARGADRERLEATLQRPGHEPTPDEVTEARSILERIGARDHTRGLAGRHRDEALEEIAALGILEPEARERLEHIVRAAIRA
jgi:geranylgeranyl diphosphate synthase type I